MRSAFSILPFKETYLNIYDTVIVPVLHKNNYHSRIARDYVSSDIIIKEIIEGIIEADIIIADISENNANVNYELGIADSFGKKVLIINGASSGVIPFDYTHRRHYKYNTTQSDGKAELEKWLNQAIVNINHSAKADVWGFPITNKTFMKSSTESEIILNKVLQRTHYANRFNSEIFSTTTIDEKGNAIREELINVDFFSDTSHILYEIYIDRPGKILLENVYEILEDGTHVEMQWHVVASSQTRLIAFLIFTDLKLANTRSKYFTKVYAENFFSDLVEQKLERYPFAISEGLSISTFKETFIFPNIDLFKSVSARIFNHPEAKNIGVVAKPKKQNDTIILEIDLSLKNKENSKSAEMLVEFTL